MFCLHHGSVCRWHRPKGHESATECFSYVFLYGRPGRLRKPEIRACVLLGPERGNRCLCSARHLLLVGYVGGVSTVSLPRPKARNNQVFPVRKANVSCRSRMETLTMRFGLVEKQVACSTLKEKPSNTVQ